MATWGSVNLHGSSADLVAEDVVSLSDTGHVLVLSWLLLLVRVAALTGGKLMLLLLSWLLFHFLGTTKDVVGFSFSLGLGVLAVVVATEGEG